MIDQLPQARLPIRALVATEPLADARFAAMYMIASSEVPSPCVDHLVNLYVNEHWEQSSDWRNELTERLSTAVDSPHNWAHGAAKHTALLMSPRN